MFFHLLLFSGKVQSYVHRLLIFILYRIVKSQSRQSNVLKIWTCKDNGCFYMSLVMRKPAFCICENKDADQLRGNRKADQRLCFRYTDSTIPLLPNPIFQVSNNFLWLYSPVCVRPGRKPRRPVFSERGSCIA